MPELASKRDTFSIRERIAQLSSTALLKRSRLSIRFFAIVIGTVFLGTVLSSALILSLEQQHLIDGARASAQRVGVVIQASLNHGMETNDKAMLTRLLDSVASEAGVEHIRILNTQGQIWLSSVPAENGYRFELNDPSCRACHLNGTESSRTAIPNSQILGQVLLNVSVIPNQPACYSCHGSTSRPLGFLFFETSLADLQSQLLASFWKIVLSAAIIFVLLVGLLIPALNSFVIRPIVKLARGAREFGAGNLDYQMEAPRGRDELSELATAFDKMRQQLKTALTEKERRIRELQMLNEVACAAIQVLDPQQILDLTINIAVNSLGVRGGAIYLLDRERERFSLHACQGMPECREMACHLWRFSRVLAGLQQPDSQVVAVPIRKDACSGIWQDPQGRSFIGVPLKARGVLMGAMTLITHPNQTVSPEGAETLKAIGEEVGLAVANAINFQSARSQATLEERERLAREMHDSLAQSLSYLKLKAAMTDDLLSRGEIAQAQESLREVKETAKETYVDLREAIFGLRRATALGSDFWRSLEAYLADYRLHYGLDVQLVMANDRCPSFSADVNIQLTRIIQEALTNVRKHARASHVIVRIEQDDYLWRVTVEDDGQGFDPQRIPNVGDQFMGLHIMRERAHGIGADLGLDSRPGGGTRVIVRVPFSSEHPNDRTFTHPVG